MRNKKYLAWVRTLPCCVCCTDRRIDPHHILGTKEGGFNVKSPDIWAVSLCRKCHTELHADPKRFEEKNGITQWEMSSRTMKRAVFEGVLTLNPEFC